jgi:hypothetical protein
MKDLSNIPLKELDILKNHAMIMLTKAERLMGSAVGDGISKTFEGKEFQMFSNIYKIYEEEMNKRIFETAIGK